MRTFLKKRKPRQGRSSASPVLPSLAPRSPQRVLPAQQSERAMALKTGGLAREAQPLDSGTKAFFGSRFGHDFGDVRIHAGPRAAAAADARGAHAFTVGSDVVFNAGKYQPGSLGGRFLLAHELAHVAQQRGVGANSRPAGGQSSGLEREASSAALRVALGGSARVAAAASAPALQCFKVSSGGFGTELEGVAKLWSIPDTTLKLLKKSPTFRNMAALLDQHYISSTEAEGHGYGAFVSQKGHRQLDASGKVSGVSPKVDGKRVIGFSFNPDGASFKAAWSPNNARVGDVIEISSDAREEFIQDLIHEAAHAVRFVTGANPSAATMAEEIKVGIQDEIAARRTEKKALQEIPDATVRARAGQVGSQSARDVQRDFAPAFGLTYLEHIYFSRKLREQKKAEGLSDVEAEEIARSVQKNPESGIFWQRQLPHGELSEFAWISYKRARVAQDWKKFFARNKTTAKDFAAKKEALLQAHLKEWMNSEVSYLP